MKLPWRKASVTAAAEATEPKGSGDAILDIPSFEPSEDRPSRADQPGYSRAFENFVNGPDDVAGLLAYALFKETIWEQARAGNLSDSTGRNPTQATVKTFRLAAEQRISELIKVSIEEATPDLQQSATTAAIATLEGQLKSHVTERTSFGKALLTNLIAWGFTVGITVGIIYLFFSGSVEDRVARSMNPEVGSDQPVEQQIEGSK